MIKYPIILIDNGHGRNTPGKCSPDRKYREYSWTREIAARIQAALTEAGFTAFLLVKEAEDVPLSERVAREHAYCRRYGRDNVLLVSIHSNAFGNGEEWTDPKGWSVWTSVGKTMADELATELYAAAVNVLPEDRKLRKDMADGDPDYEDQFYILRKTQCPAVLTENFFHTNRDDLAFITSEAGKECITRLHVEGIANYIRKHYLR